MKNSIEYPTKCRIIDATGSEFAGYDCITPEISVPHIGKTGIAERVKDGVIFITLEDGNVLMGHDCWWEPINENQLDITG